MERRFSADVLRLNDEDRRRSVICGIGGGFAAVFGTPVSGALFGIEVLYLGQIEYSPVPVLHDPLASFRQTKVVFLAIGCGAALGLAASS